MRTLAGDNLTKFERSRRAHKRTLWVDFKERADQLGDDGASKLTSTAAG